MLVLIYGFIIQQICILLLCNFLISIVWYALCVCGSGRRLAVVLADLPRNMGGSNFRK